jgi:hypothetical protein
MLGTRAVVAVVAEVYTIAMERSLKRLDDQPRARPLEAMPPTAGVGAAIPADRA